MSRNITTGMLNGVIVGGIPINTSLPCNTGNFNSYGSRSVTYVVMHYTGNSQDLARSNANYFANGERGASAHLFVDESSIYQSVKLCDMAWQVGADTYYHRACRNTNAIGIEMCCSGNYKVSEKTKENAAQLCAYICKLIGIDAGSVDAFVLRHWDVTHKSCPAQMAGSNNSEWAAFKERVKQILKGEDNMTPAEVKKLAGEEFDRRNPTYNTIEDVPSYWRDDIQAMMEQGIIAGTGDGKLGLTKSECKAAVIVWRAVQKK